MEGHKMYRKNPFLVVSLFILIVVTFLGISGCSGSVTKTATATPPGGVSGGSVINSDSIITAKIMAIRQLTSGYPWELDIMIQSSTDVDSLPNPTRDSIGQVITVKTDQDMVSFKVSDVIKARVKYVGDVPKPGITLYMYSVAKS
jgi:hypothetical protein